MRNDQQHIPSPKESFADDALWNVIGRAEAPNPGPFFVQETLRQARGAQRERRLVFPSEWTFFGAHPVRNLAMGAAAMCLLFATWLTLDREGATNSDTRASVTESAVVPDDSRTDDVEVIKELDVLLALEESTTWTEDVF
jgi:hypothetical protein